MMQGSFLKKHKKLKNPNIPAWGIDVIGKAQVWGQSIEERPEPGSNVRPRIR